MNASPAKLLTWADVERLEGALAQELPRFAIRYKDESPLQRAIAALVRPFNAVYLTDYTTVMFGKVYFPSRRWRLEQGPTNIYITLRHEAVHLRDMRRFPVLFHLSYVFFFPAGVTARAFWEWRGYRETLWVRAEHDGHLLDVTLDHIERSFTGPAYLYMCPFPGFVRRKLRAERARIYEALGL